MSKRSFPPREALFPLPVALVSCGSTADGTANIITIAWCGVVCSAPPAISVSIRPSRHSHELIKRYGSFVVNVPTADMVERVDGCGIVSGRDVNKFEEFRFKPDAGTVVSAPLIRECPVNIECRLISVTPLGAHDLFLGEVAAVHADCNMLTPSGGIDYSKAGWIVYNQGEYWDLGKRIGRYGYSKK